MCVFFFTFSFQSSHVISSLIVLLFLFSFYDLPGLCSQVISPSVCCGIKLSFAFSSLYSLCFSISDSHFRSVSSFNPRTQLQNNTHTHTHIRTLFFSRSPRTSAIISSCYCVHSVCVKERLHFLWEDTVDNFKSISISLRSYFQCYFEFSLVFIYVLQNRYRVFFFFWKDASDKIKSVSVSIIITFSLL